MRAVDYECATQQKDRRLPGEVPKVNKKQARTLDFSSQAIASHDRNAAALCTVAFVIWRLVHASTRPHASNKLVRADSKSCKQEPQITCPICRKPFGDESGPAPQDDLESGRPRADSVPSPMGSTAPLRRARPPPMIELQPANNDLETRVQPVEVPGDDDYTLS